MASENNGLKIPVGMAVLVTTDDWFTFADGGQYKGVLGTPKVIKPEDLVGFQPKGSTDWMLRFKPVGRVEELYVAGCKVHYLTVVRGRIPCPKDVLDLRDYPNSGA